VKGARVDGPRLYLDALVPEDVDDDYVGWMNDPEVVRHLESRYSTHTRDELVDYVRRELESADDVMFGVHTLDGAHIGNIKIGGIDDRHRFADVGLIIGAKSAWGQGYGTEAIELVTGYAFEVLGLNKLTAGIYATNTGSHKAFLKAGWREVGRLERHRMLDGVFVDQILVEKLRDPAEAR